jgi:hypothetical protein
MAENASIQQRVWRFQHPGSSAIDPDDSDSLSPKRSHTTRQSRDESDRAPCAVSEQLRAPARGERRGKPRWASRRVERVRKVLTSAGVPCGLTDRAAEVARDLGLFGRGRLEVDRAWYREEDAIAPEHRAVPVGVARRCRRRIREAADSVRTRAFRDRQHPRLVGRRWRPGPGTAARENLAARLLSRLERWRCQVYPGAGPDREADAPGGGDRIREVRHPCERMQSEYSIPFDARRTRSLTRRSWTYSTTRSRRAPARRTRRRRRSLPDGAHLERVERP